MSLAERADLAGRVRAEFLHAWRGYARLAWGHDELRPVSGAPHDWYRESLAMTPVDAFDTMLLMGLQEEAHRTRTYIARELSFDKDITVKNFEITIRLLGGLLSAYQMTGEPRFLGLADDLGTRLLPAFGSPTGMPYMFVNLATGATSGAETNPAEIGTLLLEFGTLARLTGKPAYFDKAKAALRAVYERRGPTGLVGEGINVETGQWTARASHVGGGIDSYYEYLVKCERLFGDPECGSMARASLEAVETHLADRAPDGGLWYGVADMTTGRRTATTYGALHAFFPTVLVLGGQLARAALLADSGFRMWTLHGIEPEELDYRTMQVANASYQLRPEIVESAYYLFQKTRDPRYLEMGRTFFEALVRHCRVENGYTVLTSVVTKEKGDLQHSFLLAETFKYLYLLFAPEAIDFDAVTFNTEAHPLRRTW
jgi:mannosidase alpha-like ER degradation enhancer 2